MSTEEQNLSKLAKFVRKCRGDKSLREFAEEIDELFTYSYIKLIEQDKRTPARDKFVEFAERYGRDLDDAMSLWMEQSLLVKTNLARQARQKRLQKLYDQSFNETEDS